MFLDTLYVLLLAFLAGGLVAGTNVVRRTLGVVSRKASIETIKMDTEIDRLKHVRTLQGHSQQNALIQLTTKDAQEQELAREKEVKKQQQVEDDRIEHVAVADKDIEAPYRFRTTEEWKEENGAAEAELA